MPKTFNNTSCVIQIQKLLSFCIITFFLYWSKQKMGWCRAMCFQWLLLEPQSTILEPQTLACSPYLLLETAYYNQQGISRNDPAHGLLPCGLVWMPSGYLPSYLLGFCLLKIVRFSRRPQFRVHVCTVDLGDFWESKIHIYIITENDNKAFSSCNLWTITEAPHFFLTRFPTLKNTFLLHSWHQIWFD